jgi:hypothetical protein
MAYARPFWTSTLQELSNGIKNIPMKGVLTPELKLSGFGSPEGLQVPTFRSVSFILTFNPKWGCDIFLLADLEDMFKILEASTL